MHFYFMSFIESSRRFIQNIGTFKNVGEIYISRLTKRSVPILKTRTGSQFFVENANNNLGTVVEVFTLREYRDLARMREKQNPTIIDIGANIGTFTMWALSQFPQARVIAFEPEATNAKLLTKNVALNGVADKVTVVEQAVCESAGVRSLSVAGTSSGKNSLAVDIGASTVSSVTCTTLDALFVTYGIDRCDCLKIDCEGAEYELLYAASESTLAKIDLILLEWHNVPGHTLEELTTYLKKSGFTITQSVLFPSIMTARRV